MIWPGYLDLAGVGQLVLDLLGDIAREQDHLVLADVLRLDHDADLAAGLDGVAAGDAGEALGDLLELFETLDVVLDVLAARAGTGRGDRVRRLDEAGLDGMRLDVAVVGLDAVDDRVALAVLAGDVHADGDVAALDLVVDGLADVVQQARALGHVHVDAQRSRG